MLKPNACTLIAQMNNDVILSPTSPIEPLYQPLEEKSNDDSSQPNASSLIVEMNNEVNLSPNQPSEPFYQPMERKNSWGTFFKKSSFNVGRNKCISLGISLRPVKKELGNSFKRAKC